MGSANDRKFMQKRLFGVSPYMDLVINNPQEGRTRAIIAKQHNIDIRDNIVVMEQSSAPNLNLK